MTILRIEHQVRDFATWKQAFDSDPAGRDRSGVRSYQVLQDVDDPNYVMIDLEFGSRSEAEGLLAAVRAIWKRPEHELSSKQQSRIVEVVDTKDVQPT